MKENILIVHNYYQVPGGEDTVVANEKRMLEENGHNVILYERDNSELKTYSVARKMLLPITTIFNLKTYNDIRKIILKHRIDVVHVHNTFNIISPAVYYAGVSMKVPVVQTVHNFRLMCPGATFYRNNNVCEECCEKGLFCSVKYGCYRGSKIQTLACAIGTQIHRFTGIYKKIHYICLTEFNKRKLLQQGQIADKQISIKPNFGRENGNIIPFSKRKSQIVYVGRLDELKGIKILLKTWKRIEESSSAGDLELVVCGTGPLFDWCADYISKNSLSKIVLKGHLPNAEAIKLIGESKAIILPTQWYEGFPMTIIEAASVGTPVIGSDIGNVGSVIQNGVNGYKFAPNDDKELQRIILTENLDLVDNVYALFREKYTKEVNYQQLLNCYREARKNEKEYIRNN